MTIYFEKDSAHWSNYSKLNELFLNNQMDYIRDIVKHRGYIYLNQICELLGIAWDTRCNNLCIEDANFTVVIGWDGENDRWVIDIY